MADNLPVTPGSGVSIAADDVGGVLYQRVKLAVGADGTAVDLAPGQATMANSLPVTLASNQGAVTVGGTIQVKASDNNPVDFSLAVVGTHTSAPSVSSAATIGKPQGATGLLAQAITQNVRFTLDYSTPTASRGFQLPTGQLPVVIPVPGTAIVVIQEAPTADFEYQWVV
jgi:hypothetical protein